MRSLVGDFWGGYCPECLSVDTEMFRNVCGFWECPECHLQINVTADIVILHEKGKGNFVKRFDGIYFSVSDAVPPLAGRIVRDHRFAMASP
jgi:hypothetical protein